MSDIEIDRSINIPPEYTSKFLGMLTLDILHDAKGKGYLYGHLLSDITNLLSLSCKFHFDSEMDVSIRESGPVQSLNLRDSSSFNLFKMYLFINTYSFFHNLWIDNLSAFGDLKEQPNFNKPFNDIEYWNYYKESVKLPVRLVAERKDEDTFISLGKNKNSIEAENYRNELSIVSSKSLIFESPRNISSLEDYFNKNKAILSFIKSRLPNSLISLDMKSAAGLLRSITDPIGYITSLPTYCDPGYNMIGMSAIRDASPVDFLKTNSVFSTDSNQDSNRNFLEKSSSFTFKIKIPIVIAGCAVSQYITLLKTEYYYGGRDDLCRENVLIKIMDDYHYSHLPSASVMASSLYDYLNKTDSISVTRIVQELLYNIKSCVYDHLVENSPDLSAAILNTLLTLTGQDFNNYLYKVCPLFGITMEPEINNFFIENKLYLIKILSLVQYYGLKYKLSDLLPERVLNNSTILKHDGFVYNFFYLLEKLSLTKNADVERESEYNEKIKLTKKDLGAKRNVNKKINESYDEFINENKLFITNFINTSINVYKKNFKFNEDYDYRLFLELENIKTPSIRCQKYLEEYIYIYYPQLYYTSLSHFNKTTYHLFALLDIIITSTEYNDILNSEITFSVPKSKKIVKENALFNVLGKFSGDFGQIIWCIANGHIFATEDNNASALALLMHQLPRSSFLFNSNPNPNGFGWGSIHGMGDGGTVNVTITNF